VSAWRGVSVGLLVAMASAWALAAPLPPGRQHRLSIEGENTVTFLARSGLDPVKFDYKLKVEYIVDTRYGKETKPSTDDKDAEPPTEEVAVKKAVVKKGSRAKTKAAETSASKVSGAIDLSLHSFERSYRQNGQSILETKASRARFQGRVQPDAPVFNVSLKDAPPPMQEILKNFDVVTASLLLNDDLKVVDRKYRSDGPQRAMIETLLSIHTPIPKGVDSWESPTQLVMGYGQTARGKLRFEKDKLGTGKSSDIVKVKVSGVLKAEGVVAGNFIKDGTYTVTGEQIFDSHTHEWTSARWSVAVANELANQAGLTVAQAKGTMTVESRAVVGGGTPTIEEATPKL
jgi:hypothetical protein